jgi:tetratricopeptide (TPR) repeat protein
VHGVLTDVRFFHALWGVDRLGLKALWARMEVASPYRLVEAYRPVVENPERSESIAWAVAALLHDTGHPAEAAKIRRFFVDECRKGDNPRRLAGALGNLGGSAWAAGDLDTAEACSREQERICRGLGDEPERMKALGHLALIARARGDLDGATACNREVERLARAAGNDDMLAGCLANQAVVHEQRGELDQAAALLRESERLCHRLADRDGLRQCLTNQAAVARKRGDAAAAVELGAKAIRICHQLGDAANLRVCEDSHILALNELAVRLAQQGRMPEAVRAVEESVSLAKQLGLPRLTEATDLMLSELKKPTSAINQRALAEEALKLIDECRSAGMGGQMDVAQAVCDMLRETLRPHEGDPWPPGRFFRGKERFLRGMIHVGVGDVRAALPLFEESVALFESVAALPGFEWVAEDLAAARGNRDRARRDVAAPV